MISVKDGERLNTAAEVWRVGIRSGAGKERSIVFQTQRYRPAGAKRRATRRIVAMDETLYFELLELAARTQRRKR